ncbi:hypothetical protein F66182_11783 [Fusarium sp. NRRL 66182]|nr:hypothetical protein F66182_11783 [Fusarium sp. NRRL 66182]
MHPKRIASAALVLSQATISHAVNIIAFPLTNCRSDPLRGSCIGISPATCCLFPTGGLIAQSMMFTLLQECDLGIWYYESPGAGTQCGIARDTVVGRHEYVCLSGGTNAPGGGAAWFDLTQCLTSTMSRLAESDPAALQAEVGPCTDQVFATLYAWPDDEPGVYALTPTREQFDEISRLPVAASNAEEVEILKSYNATYYEDPALLPGHEHEQKRTDAE